MNKRVVSIVVLAALILSSSLAGIAQAGAAPSLRAAATLLPNTGTARACIDLLCPDGRPRDAFCRCRPSFSSPARDLVVRQIASSWLPGTGTVPRGCIDLMCPDGRPRDAFCRCRPMIWSPPTA